jgi:hypothetical protein
MVWAKRRPYRGFRGTGHGVDRPVTNQSQDIRNYKGVTNHDGGQPDSRS